jgi:hypothetical protein
MDHRSLRQLAAGDALEDLGRIERLRFSAHVLACASCRQLRRELDTLTGDLSLLAPPRRPPAALQASVMAALGIGPSPAGAALPVAGARPAGGASTPDAAVRRWRIATALAAGTAATVTVVAVGLGVMTARLESDLAASLDALDRANAQLVAQAGAVTVALDPAHVTAPLEADPIAAGATAYVVYRPGTDDSYLMAMDLPPTPADHVYQLWFADSAGVHALDTFAFDGEGTFIAPFGISLDDATAAMVTLEPAGGSQGAPGPEVVFGEL